jgi:hypothetical protein
MSRRSNLIALFLAATLLADCAFIGAIHNVYGTGEDDLLVLVAAYALSFSQVGLAAVWLTSGISAWPLRFLTVIVTAVGWSAACGAAPSGESWKFCLSLMFAELAVIAGVLSGLRLRGIQLVDEKNRAAIVSARKFQFSMARMLMAMAACGLFFALARQFTVADVLDALIYGPFLGVSTLICAAAILSTRFGKIFGLLLATTLAAEAYLAWSNFSEDIQIPALMYLGETLLVTGSLVVFRICGYRLGRPRQAGTENPPEVDAG